MLWRKIVLTLIRCELKAQCTYGLGWRISAKGALPIVVVVVTVVIGCWR
jgi:hypothetical protein